MAWRLAGIPHPSTARCRTPTATEQRQRPRRLRAVVPPAQRLLRIPMAGHRLPAQDRVVHAFFAGGAGGQVVMVIREPDLVVAIYAGKILRPSSIPARCSSSTSPETPLSTWTRQ